MNTDPAKNLNPDPDLEDVNPDPDPSYFLTLSEKIKLNSYLIIKFSRQKKSIERQNVLKVTTK